MFGKIAGFFDWLHSVFASDWVFFTVLIVWFVLVLLLEFVIVPRCTYNQFVKRYQKSSSFPNVKQEILRRFNNSSFKEVYSAYLRALTKKWMYVALTMVAMAYILGKLIGGDAFDIVAFFSACIASLEAVDSHHVMKEKHATIKNIDSRLIDDTLFLTEKEAQLLVMKEEQRYNSLSPFEQFMEKIPKIPIKKASVIMVDGHKEKCDVEIKRTKDGESDAFELLFDRNVKFVDRHYVFDTAEYNFDDKNTFKITKTNNKKYTIAIDMRSKKSGKGA